MHRVSALSGSLYRKSNKISQLIGFPQGWVVFDFPALSPNQFCSAPPNDAEQAVIAIIGMIVCVATVLLARQAYHRSFKATEINDELIRRFVESAPMWRLKALQHPDDKTAEQQLNSKDDDQKQS